MRVTGMILWKATVPATFQRTELARVRTRPTGLIDRMAIVFAIRMARDLRCDLHDLHSLWTTTAISIRVAADTRAAPHGDTWTVPDD